MKIVKYTLFTSLLIINACTSSKTSVGINSHTMKKGEVIDDYFGTKVSDPYRWLEDDNSKETKKWVDAENEITYSYLDKIPFRDAIKNRLTQIWDYASSSAPYEQGGLWIESRNNGKQNQSVLYYRKNLSDEAQLLLDPNTLSDDGTVALGDASVSKNGKYLAYAISRSGSDWREIYVMDIETKQILSDKIEWAKFTGIAWYKDGFYYNRYPAPEDGDALKGENKNAKVYYHKVGTPQSNDVLVYEDTAHPDWGFYVQTSKDESYAVMYTTESTSGTQVAVFTPNGRKAKPISVVSDFNNEWSVVGRNANTYFVLTNYNAPRYQVLAIDANKPSVDNAKVLIPESKETLLGVDYTGKQLFCSYLKDASSMIKQYNTEGKLIREVDLPGIGSVSGFYGNDDSENTFFTLSSYTTPSDIYEYNIKEGSYKLFKSSSIAFESTNYTTKQVFYKSKDGTKVPMFITYKKGIELKGNAPTLLYGYGGFNASITPGSAVTRVPWLENGGVLAVACIRGGGEYGQAWHKAGTKMQKQNVFDDFIAAAEYLQAEGYTNNKKLAIQGGSNGGLLVGACMTQRPDLFAVALPAVGVMDMLRYQHFTIGRYWASDYGTSEDSKEMFDYIHAYSPLHNIKAGVSYPATLVTTADHDDRVVPAHSFKFAATLQEKGANTAPYLIMISKDAGHGAGKPKSKTIEEYANIWAFTLFNMNETYKAE